MVQDSLPSVPSPGITDSASDSVAPTKPARTKESAVKKTVTKPRGRNSGPGTRLFKFKASREPGECDIKGCSTKVPGRARRCAKHKKEVRKAQLRENNLIWRKRVARGQAKHHVVYTSPVAGKRTLTEWARQNPERALKLVKNDFGVVDLEEFRKLLKLAEKSEAKTAKKAARVARKESKVVAKTKKAEKVASYLARKRRTA